MNIILLSGGSGKRLWPLSNGAKLRKEEGRFKKKTHFNRASQKKPY